ATGVGGETVAGTATVTYSGSAVPPTAAGLYAVSATFTSFDPRYSGGTRTRSILINPATPGVVVTGGPYTYDGSPHAATVFAVGPGGTVAGSFSVTYNGSSTVPTNAGSYAVSASFSSGNANFTGATGTGTLVINKATAAVTLTPSS